MKRFISVLVVSMSSLQIFVIFAFAANPTNAQYYTKEDFLLYSGYYSEHLFWLYNDTLHLPGPEEELLYQARASEMALESIGFPEVPVEGAQRSDYVAPSVPDPDPDAGTDNDPDSNKEGGVIMEEMLAQVSLVSAEVFTWVGNVGTTIESNPLLLTVTVLSVSGIAIDWFLKLVKQR